MMIFRAIILAAFSITALNLVLYQGIEFVHAFMDMFHHDKN
ncbi:MULTISPECIES: hypothetical protein [Bacillus]|uniref:Uncharacterized protein n=1 Tax=Bacillus capparidis TaxID=1840411 RepID=A0ABS4CRH8_9BACI|nr:MULTISPECIES: hypothetical protein [Bacillus]MBP1080149.1 hypothetical protein [Bacillus capparidis]MED1095532.1 hypothetical protein [Bacillus capparidis]